MRLAIVGTALAAALMIAGPAAAQGKMEITGTKAFCLKSGNKAECAFDTMSACQKGVKDKSTAGAEAPACVSRSEAR